MWKSGNVCKCVVKTTNDGDRCTEDRKDIFQSNTFKLDSVRSLAQKYIKVDLFQNGLSLYRFKVVHLAIWTIDDDYYFNTFCISITVYNTYSIDFI